jgi:hypothetical protein
MEDGLLKQFEHKLSDEEDFLNGLKLYYRLIPAAIRWTNAGSIKRISKRMTTANDLARLLIKEHKGGRNMSSEISRFHWPERWAPIESRVLASQVAWIASDVNEEDPEKMTKAELKKIKARVQDFI